MKLITHKDIISLNVTSEMCYDWAVDMIREKKTALLPPKISIKPKEGVFCNVMPSFVPCSDGFVGGVKVVTRYPNRSPSLDSKILLFDAGTGNFLALMDGNWITAMRTGAVAAHSVLLFAKSNFSTIGVMGLGNVSRATMQVLASKICDRNITIKLLKHNGDEKDFAEKFKDFNNFNFEFVENYFDLVKGSDVVLSGVTYAPENFCSNDAFDEGVLVQPIHTLGFTNCDLFFDKVFADDYGHVCNFKNFEKFKNFAEVCDVVNGIVVGRENDLERILAYNVGTSTHDINFAANIYKLLCESTNMEEFDFKEPTEKFWV